MRRLVLILILVVGGVQSAAGQSDFRILFVSDRDGERESYLMMDDGTNVLRVTSAQRDQFWRASDPYNQYQQTPQGTFVLTGQVPVSVETEHRLE